MGNRFYLMMLALGCGGFLIFFFLMSTRMEAFSGSGTRLGGFLEAEYGWREPQTAFSKAGFTKLDSLAQFRQPVDVIVIGDSFVEDERIGWVNYLAYDYGLSVAVFHIDKLSIADLLVHEIFITSPPKYVLYTSNEGLSVSRFARNPLEDSSPPAPYMVEKSRGELVDRANEVRGILQRETSMEWHARMGATGDWIKKSVQRALFGPHVLPVIALPIQCDACFSHSRQESFLVMRSTLAPSAYPRVAVARAAKQLQKLREHIEGNAYSEFRTVIFPSKLNVYSSYVPDVATSNLIDPALSDAPIGYIDLLPSLRAAIASGTRDVYLPNDHHMGANGYAIAARIIAQSLQLRE